MCELKPVLTEQYDWTTSPAASAHVLESASEAAGIGAFEWRIWEGSIAVSPSLERLWELEPGTSHSSQDFWISRIIEDDRPRLNAVFAGYKANRQNDCALDFRIRTSHAGEKWLHLKAKLDFSPSGQPVRMIGINMEISANPAPIREFQIARLAAEQSTHAKSAFLTAVSHELRSPLSAIVGFSRLLRERAATEEQCRDLDIITRSGEHLLGLVNNVLDLAKSEAGHSGLELAPCDLWKILRDVTGMMRMRAYEKHLALTLSIEDPAFHRYVVADAARLRQVLINLVGNAIANTERGSITLRFNAIPSDDGKPLVLRFEVEDTGIGIAVKDQERIFDSFVQLGKPDKQKGAGLCLAITRQYIELMGGTI